VNEKDEKYEGTWENDKPIFDCSLEFKEYVIPIMIHFNK